MLIGRLFLLGIIETPLLIMTVSAENKLRF